MHDPVKRIRFSVSALLEGPITPDHVMEDWPDWVSARSRLRGHLRQPGAQELEIGARLPEAIEEEEEVILTDADRDYLGALEERLGMYPEMRTTE
ncbi:MAG: hypothetical protein ACLQRM_06935 [Acidimicrobiales bacterium]